MAYYGPTLLSGDRKTSYNYGTPEYAARAAQLFPSPTTPAVTSPTGPISPSTPGGAAASSPVPGTPATRVNTQPSTAPAATPTFLPPATNPAIPGLTSAVAAAPQAVASAAGSGSDPQVQALVDQLKQQLSATTAAQPALTSRLAELSAPINIPPPDTAGLDAQSAQVQALIGQLMQGKGVGTVDVTGDPAAAAFAATSQRGAEAARQAEAERTAASGVSGSGDFNSRVAQIAEQAGMDRSAFNANLANQRRTENIANALSAAGLSETDIAGQRTTKQQTYADQLAAEQARRAGIVDETQLEQATSTAASGRTQQLLDALLAQENAKRSAAVQAGEFGASTQADLLKTLTGTDVANRDFALQTPTALLQQALLQQQVQQGARQPLTPIPPAGGLFSGGRTGGIQSGAPIPFTPGAPASGQRSYTLPSGQVVYY